MSSKTMWVLAVAVVVAFIGSTLAERYLGPRIDAAAERTRESRNRVAVLLMAIKEVESGGDEKATGDGGTSRGAYQIGRLYWEDGREQLEREGERCEDYKTGVWSGAESARVVLAYFRRYAPADMEDLKQGVRVEVAVRRLARIHNGGPKGAEKECTVGYGEKVWQRFRDLR